MKCQLRTKLQTARKYSKTISCCQQNQKKRLFRLLFAEKIINHMNENCFRPRRVFNFPCRPRCLRTVKRVPQPLIATSHDLRPSKSIETSFAKCVCHIFENCGQQGITMYRHNVFFKQVTYKGIRRSFSAATSASGKVVAEEEAGPVGSRKSTTLQPAATLHIRAAQRWYALNRNRP